MIRLADPATVHPRIVREWVKQALEWVKPESRATASQKRLAWAVLKQWKRTTRHD